MTALDRCKVCRRETEHTQAIDAYGSPRGWRCACGAWRPLLTARAVLSPPQAVPR